MTIRPVTTAQYRNPHATMPFSLRFLVVRNTSDEQIEQNIRANVARDVPWQGQVEAHDGVAVIVGGGPSAADNIEDIRNLNGTVFAGNGASQFIGGFCIPVHYQVIGDAKPETEILVDRGAKHRLIASQVNPATLDQAIACGPTTLWHLNSPDNIETLFPPDRLKRGGYSLVNGSSTVGDFCVRLAYVLGYRTFHIFGFDSCHREGKSHAYPQPMNDTMPCTAVEWGGRQFYASLAMKAQAERFQITARLLEEKGCKINVYGDGLLQSMFRVDPKDLSEKDLYRLMWQYESYRKISPGEHLVDTFMEIAKPEHGAQVIDFGCGTGRASVAMHIKGLAPVLVDFADNCRDMEAILLPFLETDLTKPIPLNAPHGFCSDVMEHIPPQDVKAVINNIMASAKSCFFQISTIADYSGALVGTKLHKTIENHEFWASMFKLLGFNVAWEQKGEISSLFYIKTEN